MTNQNRKRAIRAYMAAHGVNYTTAARALTATTATPTGPGAMSRLEALKTALGDRDEAAANAALRAGAPGPHPWDLAYALASLAHDDAALHEHTRDPETPVTADLLRLALLAEASHGHHHHARHGESAADVCRSALLALPITSGPETPTVDGQHPVHPDDLAAIIATLADDPPSLDEHASPYGFDADYLAEALLLLAADLTDPHAAGTPARTVSHAHHPQPVHHLIVTAEPLTAADHADLNPDALADHRYAPDRTYTIDCPGIQATGCEGWDECTQCWHLGDTERDELEETGHAHGEDHQYMRFGWATATGLCSLHAYPDAWAESAADLNLPPGRYAIDHDWDEGCTLILITV